MSRKRWEGFCLDVCEAEDEQKQLCPDEVKEAYEQKKVGRILPDLQEKI